MSSCCKGYDGKSESEIQESVRDQVNFRTIRTQNVCVGLKMDTILAASEITWLEVRSSFTFSTWKVCVCVCVCVLESLK